MASSLQGIKNHGKSTSQQSSIHDSVCAICLKVIVDRSENVDGEDSVFCEGHCQSWLHRTCAGLTDPAFDAVRNSADDFLCFKCQATAHAAEIKELHAMIATLTKEVATLRSMVVSATPQMIPTSMPLPISNVVPNVTSQTKDSNSSGGQSSCPDVADPSATPKSKSIKQSIYNDRKFNLVFFGLDECPKGTARAERLSRDEGAIVHSIQKRVPSFNSVSIRDCFRLGKYVESSSRPRPILATLNKATDVSLILSKRYVAQDGIHIKPDLPPEARRVQSLLLKERWSLIDQVSIDKKSIKLRGNSLFIGERLHGRVQGNEFVRCDSLGDVAPALNSIGQASPDISSRSSSPPSHLDSSPFPSNHSPPPSNVLGNDDSASPNGVHASQ